MNPSSTSHANEHRISSSHSCLLSSLQRVDILPERYSQAMASIARLKKIASLRVKSFVRRNGTLYYVIDVFLHKPSSRILTRAGRSHSGSPPDSDIHDRAPDFQVERRFSEFTKLRSSVYRLAQSSHNLMRCGLCDDIVNSTLLGSDQPKRYMSFMLSNTSIAHTLTQFLRSLMRITMCINGRGRGDGASSECVAREQIPQLLLIFLQLTGDAA